MEDKMTQFNYDIPGRVSPWRTPGGVVLRGQIVLVRRQRWFASALKPRDRLLTSCTSNFMT